MNVITRQDAYSSFNYIARKNRADLSFHEILFLKDQFITLFLHCYENDGIERSLDILDAFIEQQPNEHIRKGLWGLYCHLINHSGDVNTAKEVALRFINLTEILSNLGKRFYGLPKILDDTHLIYRIGECVNQTVSTIALKRLGVLKEKPVVPIPVNTHHLIANSAFLPYLEDTFEIITDENHVQYLEKMKSFSPYSTVLTRYNDTLWGSHGDTYNTVHSMLAQEKNQNPIAFELKDETEIKALRFLKKHQISQNDEFVVFHVREGGNFYDKNIYDQNEDRNYNPNAFLDSLRYILKQGLKIIRIGNKNMTTLPAMNGLIDLTLMPHPGEIDIFACAKAKF